MIVYREGHALDYEALAELFESVGWGERAADRVRLVGMVRASPWVVSAWEGDRLVGFCRAITDGYTTAYVTDVLVADAYRRQGIATALMERLMRGREAIRFVLRAEPEVQPLYLRLGFEPAPTMLRRKPR
jgi:GNAT superfamily N-acetyltransferase